MRIDLGQLLTEVGLEEVVEFCEKWNEDLLNDVSMRSNVEVKAKLINTGMGILLRGELKTTLIYICSSCLKPFNSVFELDFEERIVAKQSIKKVAYKEYEIVSEDILYTYDGDNQLDFKEMIRELVILNLPIAPKCDINCRVQNLNSEKKIDPRFKILEKLKMEGK